MSLQLQIPVIQFTLDDALAETAKREALAQVETHAAPDWKDYALETVKQVAQHCSEFSTDRVLEALQDSPITTHELRALGPVMVAAARAGYIVATDRFENSASVSRHKAPKRIWASLICKGATR